MGTRIIYKREYSDAKHLDTYPKEFDSCSSTPIMSADEFLRKLIKDYVFVLMPERLLHKDAFVQKAIAFSETYEIDLVITEKRGGITAVFSFEHAAFFTNLKDVFMLADEILVSTDSNEQRIIVSVSYYTHRIQKKNGEASQEI